MPDAIRMNASQFAGITLSTVMSLLAISTFMTIEVLMLDSIGASAFMNGLVCSLFFIVIILSDPFIHKLINRFGHRRLYFICKMVLSASFLLILVDHSIYAWALSSFIMGVAVAFLWPLTEASIAELAPAEQKGKFTGLYQTALAIGFAVGPFIASVFGNHIKELMVFCCIISSASYLAARHFPWHSLAQTEDFTSADTQIPPQFKLLMAALLISAFIGGFFENGLNGLSILIGKEIGLTDKLATIVPGVIAVGSFLSQYPIGVWADKNKSSRVLLISLTCLAAATLPLPLVFAEKHFIWFLAFVWGAAGGALYTLAIIIIAKHVDNRFTVQATGLVVAAYTVGCAVSPSIGGISFDIALLSGVTLLFLVILLTGIASISYCKLKHGNF